ncbi:uncharacterized protein LOC120090215 isoform X1 [Benincasa hispida]|uniref:uncharacterized protein LOC120090215 isoform X1 n=1 Tax=Benincasa hispida TaxID=102211 RepID=UPI001901A5EB|nr:uncharacterized protein LOC120090215 isoform X1 [Benincasa hispida]
MAEAGNEAMGDDTPTPTPTPTPTLSSSSEAASRHVVVVMDGMEEFTTEPLKWALDNVIKPGCVVTLIGAMPWLNIPLSSKTWLDIWPINLEEMSFERGEREYLSEAKYAKLEAVISLCRKYGVFILFYFWLLFSKHILSLNLYYYFSFQVVPQKKVIMGHPLRLLIVEQISSLHATWVVFDKHQRSNRAFYAKKIKSNMVMLKEDGGVDMINREPEFPTDSTLDSKQSYYSLNS